jgi:hypothetical protein
MKPPEKTPPQLESDKANELNKQMRTEVEKLIGGDLTGLEATSKVLAELSQSVAYIGSRDDANLLSKSLNEALQAFTPEQAQPFIDLIQNYHKDNPVKQTFINSVEPFKANELNKQMRTEVEKLIGGDLTGLEATSKVLAELSQSVAYIGSRDDANLLSKSLNEALQAFTPEQAQPFIDLIQNYHKDNPVKQAFINSVEPFKANELNKQISAELNKVEIGPLTREQLLAVAELSQSVAHIRDQDDILPLTKYLDEVVKNLTPEQAQPILDLVNKYHENDPTKQALVSSVVKDVILKKPEVDVALDTMGLVSSDEITQSIRDNVITKQQAYLQGEIAKTMSIGDGVAFNKKTPEEMRAYLGTEQGKAATKEVMKTKEAQSAMNKIEVEGYRELHKIDSFKNVGWTQETGTKVRIAEIKNDAGDIVASLKETTVNAAPTQVTLEDGTIRTVKSYRQIDFPKNLEDGKGPAHFSMAVKDENGNNISAKDAVYFTAHYDDAGKLTEVSSPVPVKFMGTGDDAIGYIERNGKVYTLPVTQGKYKEMMQEVAINNGLSVDLGQAVDSVSIPPPTYCRARTTSRNTQDSYN